MIVHYNSASPGGSLGDARRSEIRRFSQSASGVARIGSVVRVAAMLVVLLA